MNVDTHGAGQPKVSILAAVHNEERFIAEMIESVQRQDLASWELLFVDDGSNDRTLEIIESYARADDRIAIASAGTKVGKVRAYNLAYAVSRGDVIVLLAGDDRLPPTSLRVRHAGLAALPAGQRAAGYFKVRYISDDPRFDGMVVPKGRAGSRSGGCLALTRSLADLLFPIDETLVSEDVWLGFGSERLAETVIDGQDVVIEGRIHAGNSHHRDASFNEMTEALHRRYRAWDLLASSERLPLDEASRRWLASMWTAENLRHQRRVMALARYGGVGVADRLAMISRAHPVPYSLRLRLFGLLTGLRGR